ncbi:hypothetical protein F0U59_25400 [Archangium gephyra]|nr:hypothetical protein F0U59_25400 [Archangium gephyra]
MQEQRGNVPKFVVSPGVFVPNEVGSRGGRGGSSDSWPAFPETRRRVLSTIVDNGVQNVVFLSGDVHCSNVSEISFEKRRGKLPLKAFSIVSSAFYWPFPFADGDPLGFVHDSKAEQDGFDIDGSVTMHYRTRGFEQDDNFTQVTHDTARNALVVRNFSRKGKLLKEPNELKLAAR